MVSAIPLRPSSTWNIGRPAAVPRPPRWPVRYLVSSFLGGRDRADRVRTGGTAEWAGDACRAAVRTGAALTAGMRPGAAVPKTAGLG